jgi:hypothetical protein
MSDSENHATQTIVGTCSGITEKPSGWTEFAIMAPGKQYPMKLSTKLPALIEQGRAVGDAVATWSYKEQEGAENPNRPGTHYMNRYFEGVELGAVATQPSGGSVPAQSGHYEALPAGDRERSIVRQTSIKAACDLYMGRGEGVTGLEDPNEQEDWPLRVIQAAARFETWILRDLTPDDSIPF